MTSQALISKIHCTLSANQKELLSSIRSPLCKIVSFSEKLQPNLRYNLVFKTVIRKSKPPSVVTLYF